MAVKAGSTQADYAYGAIRADILSCRLPPGTKISIADTGAALRVSISAVREALSRLAAEGMAVATAQKGYTVPTVSPEELLDLTRTRVAIEGLCLKNSVENGDLEWEARLVAAYHRLQRLPEREQADPNRLSEAWSVAHQAFHDALVAGCTSPSLRRIQANLYAQTDRYRRLSVPLRSIERDVAEEHRQIFEAALARDGEKLAALMERHLMLTAEIVIRALRDQRS